MRSVRLAIRDFVESMFLSGDLSRASASPNRAMEGTRIHQEFRQDRGENYTSEVSVSHTVCGKYVELQLFGRIDGLIVEENKLTIEEVKSIGKLPAQASFEGIDVHWAQAKVYATIYCQQHQIESIWIDLAYFELSTNDKTVYRRQFTAQDLSDWFDALCARYFAGADMEEERLLEAQRLNRQAGFPFQAMRPGQQEMMDAVYDAVSGGQPLFISAPTGIGKTMGVLFPAVKAMGDGHCRKLFYLSARNPVKAIAEEAVRKLLGCGFALRSITLTAKETICPFPRGTSCNPQFCDRAAGFFDRLFPALDELPAYGQISRRAIEKLAEKHTLCPHELSLFVAEVCDVIIGDYNYAFDPRVRLKRFFDRGGDYHLLVDEAHNLVDRARDMFSALIAENTLRAYLDETPLFVSIPAQAEFISAAQELLDCLLEMKAEIFTEDTREVCLEAVPWALLEKLEVLLSGAEPLLEMQGEELTDSFLNLFFEAKVFRDIQEELNECYRIIFTQNGDAAELQLRCIDPAENLQETYQKVNGAVFFSATLTPFAYYSRLLGTGGEASCLMLPSPYPREHLKTIVMQLDTAYAQREKTAPMLADALSAFLRQKEGNYLFFFPSYQYMQKIHALFCEKNPGVFAPIQVSGMSERDRAQFLSAFDREHDGGMACFALMGGIFGEGIDLVGDKVIGVAIIGVGIPQISLERGLIQQYHDELYEPGYDYAYTIPGFNKVMQAVGRLIRRDDDKGISLLIDKRFTWNRYQELMPEWWTPLTLAKSPKDIEKAARSFWEDMR